MSAGPDTLVSVIVPAYNHEIYVRQSIASLLAQTYRTLEIIIVNDGSSDDTGTICKEFAEADPRIQYVEQSNHGAHHAINEGIRRSSGHYLAILNSDDVYYPHKVERCLEVIRRNNAVQLVSGAVELIDGRGNIFKRGIEVDWQKRAYSYFKKTRNLPLSILNENFIATTSNMFFTRSLWERVGGFQPLRYCHDLDFLMTAFGTAPYFFDEDSVHVQYRVHPGNTIKENVKQIKFEIGAVIAVSLVKNNTSIVDGINVNTIRDIKYFLRNKDLSELIIVLMMHFIAVGDRRLFFEQLQQKELRQLCGELLT